MEIIGSNVFTQPPAHWLKVFVSNACHDDECVVSRSDLKIWTMQRDDKSTQQSFDERKERIMKLKPRFTSNLSDSLCCRSFTRCMVQVWTRYFNIYTNKGLNLRVDAGKKEASVARRFHKSASNGWKHVSGLNRKRRPVLQFFLESPTVRGFRFVSRVRKQESFLLINDSPKVESNSSLPSDVHRLSYFEPGGPECRN